MKFEHFFLRLSRTQTYIDDGGSGARANLQQAKTHFRNLGREQAKSLGVTE